MRRERAGSPPSTNIIIKESQTVVTRAFHHLLGTGLCFARTLHVRGINDFEANLRCAPFAMIT